MPNQRTIVVLGALIAGMTLTSGLLLLLEPGPIAPFSGLSLRSLDRSRSAGHSLFDTAPPKKWKAIVIHDSGRLTGSSRSLNAAHEKTGRGGLGYHFVIDNGHGQKDGMIELGYRWRRQFSGAYVHGPGAPWFNDHGIGVCLIGDADRRPFSQKQLHELVWLVQKLQKRFHIPREAVYVEVGSGGDRPRGKFPFAWFRGQLLSARLP